MTAEHPAYPQATIEALIDKMGVHNFLEAVAIVCNEKGDHVAETWQDNVLAARWYCLVREIEDAAEGTEDM